nr:SAM-dependent methyltransferase [Litorivivens lipolytica]
METTVRRHLEHPFRKPITAHTQAAFDAAANWLASQHRPLLLDSFCGTGESTVWLAQSHPDCAVIGIDKSAARLDKQKHLPDNALLVRADADDFWRLALAANWQPQQHTLFYPNPWPKSEHLKRRVQGSPLLPTLLNLGGIIELRTNWRIYAEEFCFALKIAGFSVEPKILHVGQPVTAFERKYHEAGQTLWQVVAPLSSHPPSSV